MQNVGNVVSLTNVLLGQVPPATAEEWVDVIDERDGWIVLNVGLLKGSKVYLEALEGGGYRLDRVP